MSKTAAQVAAFKAWLVDTAERVVSTFGEAGISYAITYMAKLSPIYMILFAPVLATLKAQIAKQFGSTVSPASLAPAQQPGQSESDAPPADDGSGADLPDGAYADPSGGSMMAQPDGGYAGVPLAVWVLAIIGVVSLFLILIGVLHH